MHFPRLGVCFLVAEIYSPVIRGKSGGTCLDVNSVTYNRFTFPLVRGLLPDNLLPFQHFRVLQWNSVLSSR